MIQIDDANGKRHAVNPLRIDRIVEAGASSCWHGIRCYIYMKDSKHPIDCRDSYDYVMRNVNEWLKQYKIPEQ